MASVWCNRIEETDDGLLTNALLLPHPIVQPIVGWPLPLRLQEKDIPKLNGLSLEHSAGPNSTPVGNVDFS